MQPLSTSAESGTASDAASIDAMPTSFGAFKPVGWVMMGLPTQAQADALASALAAAGWASNALLHFSQRESLQELSAMVANPGSAAGFGYEITMLRRYVELAHLGWRWLLVKADDANQASTAAEIARSCGATLAVYYRTLYIEELI